LFEENRAKKSGGAIAIEKSSSYSSNNTQFSFNLATDFGGAIFVGRASTFTKEQ
jgi:predicted outer membrane repeat protein